MPDKSEHPRKPDKDTGSFSQRKDSSIRESNQHVVRRGDGWAVVGAGNPRDTVRVPTQREAIERAREIAKNSDSQVILHDKDGRPFGREVFRNLDWETEPYATETDTEVSIHVSSEPDLGKYIEKRYYGERPHIRGRRLLVSMIAANEQANHWNNQQLADEFGISEEEVLAALLYYREHKSEIDRQDAEAQQEFDEKYRLHGEQPKS